MTYDYLALQVELIRDEKEVLVLYDDKTGKPPVLATGGKITTGIGHNLTAKGITMAQSREWLAEDIAVAERDLDHNLPWWRSMVDVRQRGLVNLCFNMGWGDGAHGLSSFKNTLKLLEAGRYADAADGFLKSKWAKDVGPGRAKRVTDQIRNG